MINKFIYQLRILNESFLFVLAVIKILFHFIKLFLWYWVLKHAILTEFHDELCLLHMLDRFLYVNILSDGEASALAK